MFALACVIMLMAWRFSLMDLTADINELRNMVSYRMFELLLPIATFYTVDLLKIGNKMVNQLEKHSFMIYACHWMMISVIMAVCSVLNIEFTPSWRFVFYLCVPLLIVTVILTISEMLKIKLPKFYGVISGGR